jgi:hypothetical protein
MASRFNCPHCGGANEYTGEGGAVRCQFCGSDVRPPEDAFNSARVARVSSKAKVWIILFVVVVFILPTCIGLGGALLGIAASMHSIRSTFIGTLVAIFASFFGG